MKQVFFGLCIFSLFLFSYPAALLADAPLAAPLSPEPKTGASFVSFPLVLNWEDVPGALAYRYELIGYQENGLAKEFPVTRSQSDPLPPAVLRFLEPGQKRLWHVKSCEDAGGTICGPWGEVWDFTYLLGPPKILTPASGNIGLPVRFDWEDVAGANSYLLKGKVDLSISFLLEQIGAAGGAIACPYALWDERAGDEGTGDCATIGIRKDEEKNLPSNYTDDDCLFTKDTKYIWQAASCLGEDETFCGPFGSKKFQTSDVYKGSRLVIPAPQLQEPKYDPAKPGAVPLVGFEDLLLWDQHECAHFSKVVIKRDGRTIQEALEMGGMRLSSKAIEKVWNKMDSVYEWSVQPCFVGDEQEIRCERTVSEPWKFKTTGAAPKNLKSVVTNTVELSWDGVEKAGSYQYQVASTQTFAPATIKKEGGITSSRLTLAHPDIKHTTSYWWRVKSCADSEAIICGAWGNVETFATFPLLAPTAPNPPDGGQVSLTDAVTWNNVLGVNVYQYRLGYACRDEKETLKNCVAYNTNVCPDTSVIRPVENAKIVPSNSFDLPYCMGKYIWAVRSCLDKDCAVANPSTFEGAVYQTLTAIQPPPSGVGLVPCGKLSNEPATPYNEVEPCQLKHAGFLLQNLLDFILWKVSLFVLLVLAVITGATSYFSLGGPNALARVKTVFRSFFTGFLILMFAWTFVNIVLMLFGFQFQFFGKWWEMPF